MKKENFDDGGPAVTYGVQFLNCKTIEWTKF